MFALSIIVPFFNSTKKSHRLLKTLSVMNFPDVELILIDDGSTDLTLEILTAFKNKAKLPATIIAQTNKGPGGARNAGLKASTGKYVWFVDSDDNINPATIPFLIKNIDNEYDFIDFDIFSRGGVINSMDFLSGEHHVNEDVQLCLLNKFGRFCSKIFKRDVLIENNIFYPEFCIYEDNPLAFIFPFKINKFLKADIVSYFHHEEFKSVTRGSTNPRFYDRLLTAEYGFLKGINFCASKKQKKIIEKKFITLFLINTVGRFISRLPSLNWLVAARVMKLYRAKSKIYKISEKPLSLMSGSINFRIRFLIIWSFSFLLSDKSNYFNKQRMMGWNRPFNVEKEQF